MTVADVRVGRCPRNCADLIAFASDECSLCLGGFISFRPWTESDVAKLRELWMRTSATNVAVELARATADVTEQAAIQKLPPRVGGPAYVTIVGGPRRLFGEVTR